GSCTCDDGYGANTGGGVGSAISVNSTLAASCSCNSTDTCPYCNSNSGCCSSSDGCNTSCVGGNLCYYNQTFYTYTDFCALLLCTSTFYTNYGTHTSYPCSCSGCTTSNCNTNCRSGCNGGSCTCNYNNDPSCHYSTCSGQSGCAITFSAVATSYNVSYYYCHF
ncbi:unnamed protein product, partial [Rotaria sordida]